MMQISEVMFSRYARYEGRSIKLRSGLQADGTWCCEYTIVEFRPTCLFSESGYPAGSFPTRDKAEAAALEVAQGVIDVRDPIGSPIHESVLV
jgi:hypothetical protein